MAKRYARPSIRKLFHESERRPRAFFYTSNLPKYLQARLVFERAGLLVDHFRSRTDPYSEDYQLGKERLLARALREILKEVGGASFLFVEDTSLRIEGLSDGDEDKPGLAVKEWFATTKFTELNERLVAAGNDRRATIKSDIALHVPGLERPVFFHGETIGSVVHLPPRFDANPQYPWLTPDTFNGWFLPAGCETCLGAMSIEESWQHDFRVQALEALVDRLEEYTAVANGPAQAFSRRHRASPSGQESLFHETRQVLIVVGDTCAGKSTFGARAEARHGFRFVDASDVMRSFRDGYGEASADDYEFARELLSSQGADVVARRVLQLFADDSKPLVIAGFRTIEEISCLRIAFPDTRVIVIESSERTRFERHLARARAGRPTTLSGFRGVDIAQRSFGLLRVAEDFADIRVTNEGSLEEYHAQVDGLVRGERIDRIPGVSDRVRPRHDENRSQLFRCLSALDEAGRPLSCDEIEAATDRGGKRILHNNANKVLRRVPELARRLETKGQRVRYELLSSGRAYIRLMRELRREDGMRESASATPS